MRQSLKSENNLRRTFLCQGFIPENSNQPVSLVCTAVDTPSANLAKSSSHNSSCSSSSTESKSIRCGDRVGKQEFSHCLEYPGFEAILLTEGFLMQYALEWVLTEGENFASRLCSEVECESSRCSSSSSGSFHRRLHHGARSRGTKQCRLFNWTYIIRPKGIVSDPECEFGKYVVEVLIFSECGCAPKICGTTTFSEPVELTYTQCRSEDENPCSLAGEKLEEHLQELASKFCEKSECETEQLACIVDRIERSEIKYRQVNINGQVCCRASVEVYCIKCICEGAPPPPPN